jgi:hypothetical protein
MIPLTQCVLMIANIYFQHIFPFDSCAFNLWVDLLDWSS